MLDKLSGSKYFSILDIQQAYFQIKIAENQKHYFAFCTPEKTWMCFGTVTAPGTWCRLINNVLEGVQNVQVYMDDILIHNETFADHVKSIRQVFERLAIAKLTVRPDKVSLCVPEVAYLGFVLNASGSPVKAR